MATATVNVGDKQAVHELDLINAKLAETAKKVASPRIDVAGATRAQATMSGLELQLDKLAEAQANARVDVNTGDSEEKLGLLDALLRKIGLTDARARVSLDDGDLKEKAAADEAALAGLGMSFGKIPLLVGGAMMALPALPGVLAAGAGAAGVAALAFGGVAKALQDSTIQSTKATGTQGKNAAQLAATEQSNAAAIEGAQRAISDARTQAAHDAITSAEQIKTAQQSLRDAETQATNDQVSSAENMARAEESLRQAEESEQQAQEALTQAREDAIRTLQQLNNSAADSALQAQQAQLDLEQATENQQKVNANAKSTDLERRQATLSVAEAQQRLKEAQQQAANATQDANKANKEGVNGLPSVVAAQKAAAAAAKGVTDAHRGVADASRQAAMTQQKDAEAIANAQRSLADANRQASWTQQKDAEAVQTAVQNLANTQKQQGLAAAASAVTGSQAVNQFAKDMAGLSPEAQRVVKDLLGLKDVVHGLTGPAQKGLLPGVDVFIKGLGKLLPALKPEIAGIAGVMGSAFAGIGKGISSSGGKSAIKTLLDEGIGFTKTLLPALGGVVVAFGKLGTVAGPAVTGLAKGLASILKGVAELLTGLGPAAKPIGSLFQSLGKIIGELGKPLAALVVLFASALAPVVATLTPLIGKIADALTRVFKAIPPDLLGNLITGFLGIAAAVKIWAIAQGILNTILDANPFVLIATAVVVLAAVIIKYHKQIWDAIKTAWNAVKDFLGKIWGDILTFAKQWWPMLLGPAGLIVKYHNDIWQFLKRMWNDIAGFFKSAWNGILGVAKNVWGGISNFFKGWWNTEVSAFKSDVSTVEKIFSACWNAVESTAKTVWGRISAFFGGIGKTLGNAFDTAVTAVKKAWNKIEDVFKAPVNFLINTVYMGGIRRLWDDVMDHIGLSSLDLPAVKGLATGGLLPGYGGGDQHLRLLESGEAVVDKDRTRKYAPLLAAMGVPGMAKGGLVGDAIDVGKMVLAASTGNQVAFVNAFKDFLPHGGGASGDLAAMIATAPVAMIKHIVSGLWAKITGAAAGSQSGGGGGGGGSVGNGGPVGGDAAANKALARKMFPWPASQWGAFDTLEMHEAGYNRFARNSSSGAYGIPQALPPTKMPFAAQAAGGSHAGPQLSWMFNYIRSVYGTPGNAWAKYYQHPGGIGWYGSGGATSAGWAVVGEHGRELVKLPGGAHVYPHGASNSMLATGSGGGPTLVQLEVASGGQSDFERFMSTWIKNYVRVKGGGSAQAAFGSGSR